MPNAANAATVATLLRAAAPDGVEVVDRHRERAVLAVQGPRSAEVLVTVLPGAAGLAELDYMAFADVAGIRVCRTGYTGEHGYELLVPADEAPARCGTRCSPRRARRRAAVRARRPRHPAHRDGLPAARPGPLAGDHARCRRAAAGRSAGAKPEFWGRDALLAEKEAGPARRLRGLRATGRGVPRPGMAVLDAAGQRVGVTTSGTFSPTLKVGHRAGADRHGRPVSTWTTRCRWTSAAAPLACGSSSRRSCPPTCADGPTTRLTRTSDDSGWREALPSSA